MHRVRLYLPERAHSAGDIRGHTRVSRVHLFCSQLFLENNWERVSKVIVWAMCSLLGVALDTEYVVLLCRPPSTFAETYGNTMNRS